MPENIDDGKALFIPVRGKRSTAKRSRDVRGCCSWVDSRLGQKSSSLRVTNRGARKKFRYQLKEYLKRILGVDITAVEGLKEISILEIISVTGIDISKWKTPEHFTSWLNLTPRPNGEREMFIR